MHEKRIDDHDAFSGECCCTTTKVKTSILIIYDGTLLDPDHHLDMSVDSERKKMSSSWSTSSSRIPIAFP